MSAGCPDEVSLLEWLERPSPDGHVARCSECARALDDLRRVRLLARACGRARAGAGPAPRRWRALGAAQRLASTAAALALFAAIGAEPLLRRRIDDGTGRAGVGSGASAAAGTVFFTSVAGGTLVARVGR